MRSEEVSLRPRLATAAPAGCGGGKSKAPARSPRVRRRSTLGTWPRLGRLPPFGRGRAAHRLKADRRTTPPGGMFASSLSACLVHLPGPFLHEPDDLPARDLRLPRPLGRARLLLGGLDR